MIDSGSDVVTVREDVLETLDLELLGEIHSKGVHGSKKTNLYKATLRIGTQEMEIEVRVYIKQHLKSSTMFSITTPIPSWEKCLEVLEKEALYYGGDSLKFL
jgi:predicted aspartyl protease